MLYVVLKVVLFIEAIKSNDFLESFFIKLTAFFNIIIYIVPVGMSYCYVKNITNKESLTNTGEIRPNK